MYKKFLIVLLGVIGVANLLNAQDPTLITINGKDISKSSFEYLYHKNNANTNGETKTLDEYLDMFISFKLKVAEAESLKLDTAASFIAELEGYRRQSARPYLTDNDYKLQLEKEGYERMKKDIELGHIFIKLETRVPNDTIDAYNKALEIVNRAKTENFEELAKELSDDPESKEKGGYLGFLTAFKTVYPFETAVYNAPVGSIAGPVRSMFGYHVIKVYRHRESRGKLLVAHILRLTNDSTPVKNVIAKNDINILYDKVQKGEDFGLLAKKHSDDTFSAKSEGKLQWIETGNVVKEFEDAAFALKNIGDVSKPIKTKFGWHIIKLLDKKAIGTFEEEKPEIEAYFSKGGRANMVSESYNKKLKQNYNYLVDEKAMNKLIKKAESLSDSIFYVKGAKLNKVLFSFADKKYTQAQLVQFMKEKKIPALYYKTALDKYSDIEVMAYENRQLEVKYPAFRNLVQEYRDGILLFNISNIEIWEKAMNDKEGLSKFFELNKANYTWEAPKYKGRIVCCKDAAVEKQVRNIFQTEPIDSIDTILRELNKEETVVKSENGLYAKGSKDVIDYYIFNTGNFKSSEDFPFVFVEGKLLERPESYKDIKGKVVQDYQAYLDTEWVKKLKAKYPVSIDKEVLKTVQ